MAATDVGTLFLDPGLRIKRFTPRLADLFNITVNDEGRPITDFTHQLQYEGLTADAGAVLRTLMPIEKEVQSRDGQWFLMRLRPYRTLDDRIDGVVVTFVDVTERRRTVQALRESEERLRNETRLVELSHSPIFVWDLDDGVVQWNRGSEQLYGYPRELALGKRKHLMLKTRVPGGTFETLTTALVEQGRWSGELLQQARDGRELTVEAELELVEIDGRRLVMESTRDITERKTWERRQDLMVSELSHRVKNTLAVVQSFAAQSIRGSRSPDEFTERFEGRLAALARAHRLLTDPWTGADLEALMREQLGPYVDVRSGRLAARGDPASLPPDLAVPLGLVLHELATNAVKYGAWSSPKGRVELDWTRGELSGKPALTVVWRELDGPRVLEPQQRGFGSRLIEKGLPNSRVRTEFLPAGLACTMEMTLPLSVSE
jgi:two-component system, chemotaxis family, CheB/CheR fusion protein